MGGGPMTSAEKQNKEHGTAPSPCQIAHRFQPDQSQQPASRPPQGHCRLRGVAKSEGAGGSSSQQTWGWVGGGGRCCGGTQRCMPLLLPFPPPAPPAPTGAGTPCRLLSSSPPLAESALSLSLSLSSSLSRIPLSHLWPSPSARLSLPARVSSVQLRPAPRPPRQAPCRRRRRPAGGGRSARQTGRAARSPCSTAQSRAARSRTWGS